MIKILSFFAFVLVFMGMPLITHAASLDRQLEFGMSGAGVSLLQTFLALDRSVYPQGLVTGYFGSLTKAAVSNFQSKNGIAMVGRVGPVTLVAINSQMNTSKVGAERRSPIISPVNVITTDTNATITWSTTEGAAAIIYYSTTPLVVTEASATSAVNISGSSFLVHSDLRTNHTAVLTGLSSNTRYYYVVYVRDSFGNESVTDQTSFLTIK